MTKILLVDDEYLILHSLTKRLKQDGAAVTAVTNGRDAIREIRRITYDICFLDVQLPDANGLDLMKTFRQISPQTKIIVMTGLCLDDAQLQSLHGHSCRYLPKPFDLNQVPALVAEND